MECLHHATGTRVSRPSFQSVTMYLLYHDSVYLDSSNCMTADHEDPEETEAVPSSLGEDEPSECDEQTLPVRKSAAKMSVVVQSSSRVAHKKLRHTCQSQGLSWKALI